MKGLRVHPCQSGRPQSKGATTAEQRKAPTPVRRFSVVPDLADESKINDPSYFVADSQGTGCTRQNTTLTSWQSNDTTRCSNIPLRWFKDHEGSACMDVLMFHGISTVRLKIKTEKKKTQQSFPSAQNQHLWKRNLNKLNIGKGISTTHKLQLYFWSQTISKQFNTYQHTYKALSESHENKIIPGFQVLLVKPQGKHITKHQPIMHFSKRVSVENLYNPPNLWASVFFRQ